MCEIRGKRDPQAFLKDEFYWEIIMSIVEVDSEKRKDQIPMHQILSKASDEALL